MDKFLEFLQGFNVQTIISMAIVFWLFSRDLKSEMKVLEAKIDKQSERTDKLYEMFIELLKNKK